MTRRVPWGLVAALFVLVPLVEIYFIIQVGHAIGAGWTVLLLIADSLLGAALLKREGASAWRALREALESYRMPARELADGALVLVGGTLLLTPGFVTDVLGFFFILPFTRPVARKALTTVISRRFVTTTSFGTGPGGVGFTTQTRRRPGPDDESVVRGDVVD